MTCREKLRLEYPKYVNTTFAGGCRGCPHEYGYVPEPDECEFTYIGSTNYCGDCWNQEVQETNEEKENTKMEKTTTKKTKKELLEEIAALKKEVERVDRRTQYENMADEMAAIRDAFVNAGFSRDEAMTLLTTCFNNATKFNMR